MSTRGAYGFIVDGKEKVTYNHSDSYPEGLGAVVLQFLKAHSLAEIKKIATRIEMVSGKTPPTKEQIEHCKAVGAVNFKVGSQETNDWYCLLRQAQFGFDLWVDGLKYMDNGRSFLSDSLFCEWAYLINLDTGMLECYAGFNQNPRATGRYASSQSQSGSDYYGVVLIKKFPLDSIASIGEDTFVAELEHIYDEIHCDKE